MRVSNVSPPFFCFQLSAVPSLIFREFTSGIPYLLFLQWLRLLLATALFFLYSLSTCYFLSLYLSSSVSCSTFVNAFSIHGKVIHMSIRLQTEISPFSLKAQILRTEHETSELFMTVHRTCYYVFVPKGSVCLSLRDSVPSSLYYLATQMLTRFSSGMV